MVQTRVIPSLLLKNRGLVKGTKFTRHQYVGDPINAVRIFNDKEVDEIVFIDITATIEKKDPDFTLLKDIATECFIPFSYGGGVRSIQHAEKLFSLGVERVIINTAAFENPGLVSEISKVFGSQSVIGAIDVGQNFFGKQKIYTHAGRRPINGTVLEHARRLEQLGVGEILLTSIDRDGTGLGFDIALLNQVSSSLSVPVIISGGAGSLQHLREAVDAGASACSVGSMFVFYGRHRAVLITYPSPGELKDLFKYHES